MTNERILGGGLSPGKIVEHVETTLTVLASSVVEALARACRTILSVTVTRAPGNNVLVYNTIWIATERKFNSQFDCILYKSTEIF